MSPQVPPKPRQQTHRAKGKVGIHRSRWVAVGTAEIWGGRKLVTQWTCSWCSRTTHTTSRD